MTQIELYTYTVEHKSPSLYLQEPPVLQHLDKFYKVVYIIGAVKHSSWDVGAACEKVQYWGEEEVANYGYARYQLTLCSVVMSKAPIS